MRWSVQVESATRVTSWSESRLPFEPKGDALEYRQALRQAVSGMVAPPGGGLRASLHSGDRAPADVENILLYNVGTGSFQNSARSNWLLIERDYTHGSLEENAAGFVHRYAVLETAAPEYWRPVEAVGRTSYSQPARVAVADVWMSVREAVLSRQPTADCSAGPLWLEMETPWQGANLAAAVKVLVDGVVSALHFDPNPDPEVVQRVATSLAVNRTRVSDLMGTRLGPLGPRRLAWKFGASGVQWNPDDGRLVAILVRQSTTPGFTFRISLAEALG